MPNDNLPAATGSHQPCKNRAEAVARLVDELGYVVIGFPFAKNLVSVRDCVKHYMGWSVPGKYFEVTAETTWDEFDETAKICGVKNPYSEKTGQFFRAVLVDVSDTQEVIAIRRKTSSQGERLQR